MLVLCEYNPHTRMCDACGRVMYQGHYDGCGWRTMTIRDRLFKAFPFVAWAIDLIGYRMEDKYYTGHGDYRIRRGWTVYLPFGKHFNIWYDSEYG